jgi:hypothetical protein
MRKIKLLFVCLIVAGTGFSKANATGNLTESVKFEITLLDDLQLGNGQEKVWTINYKENDTSVTVVKQKTGDGFAYIVHSEFFDVCYQSTAKGFGIGKLRKQWCNVDSEISQAVLNADEMARQRIIIPGEVDDETVIGLIASYLPMLLNPAYAHLLT